ncbi:DNA topoisomerase [Entophlyctis helioformis]|nr:DNA topoisomerase [Entophlyctis helioformis]
MSSDEDNFDDFNDSASDVEEYKPAAKKKPAAAPRPKKALQETPPSAEMDGGSDDEYGTAAAAAGSSAVPPKRATPKKNGKSKTIEEIYQKKSQVEHILLRPDSYIGSIEMTPQPLWILENDRMVYKTFPLIIGRADTGLVSILVNRAAADNKMRDSSMDTIKVTIDRENNRISVYNNGRGIPIEIHAEEKVYVPELIFGHLLTSSNYDDEEKKVVGGRNGYGAKLCNIFSTQFTFKQVFSNNMSIKGEPVLSDNKKGEDYTRITFMPDLAKFKMASIDDNFEALLKKRVYDLAGCVRGVKVYLNDTRIKIKDFKEYIQMYIAEDPKTGVKPTVAHQVVNDRWEIACTMSEGQFNQVSFANSICTTKGGTHVNAVTDQIVAGIIEAVKKKDKKGVPLKPFQAKSHIWVFVNCLIENPTFDSQTKDTMTLRPSAFGSTCPVSEEFLKKVLKSGVVESVLSYAKFKQEQLLKKTDGSGKQQRISGHPKLDDANNAGTRNGSKCTLILTEGDSAKSLAVSGLAVVGRDNFGVFPLRGKLLNVREASSAQIMGNAEISAIKQIMGLQQGKVYEDTSSLRYGHLMIMTDQDHDGSHIKGLIINFLDHFWPSLLRIPGFLLEFITPIVKVTRGTGANKREVSFFTIPEYEQWKQANDEGRGWTIKYYKGLGTSSTADAKVYFSDMDKHLKPFSVSDEQSRELIDMAFNKKKADERKEWLRRFQPGTYMDHSVPQISLPDFINRELILFSIADNARSIPSSVDGFKPGQRKILYACFKRNLKNEIKVAQLAGYVAEHSAYHHGEQSLNSTIVNMAQTFVGSNNMPVLEPIGQFGTRLQGGKDAASPRYIFTNLSPLARAAFHPADDALLTYLVDDGQRIEPEWYLPILPMLLVNGSDGIGTGWSSTIPNYNPRDIVECIYRLMDGLDLPELHPWYRGFTGSIEKETGDRYRITGTIRKLDATTVEITELPIRTWTQSYKEQLESWLHGTDKSPAWIRDYKEYHTDSKVHFVVTVSESVMAEAEAEGLEKRFKLTSSMSVSNLVCFDLEGRIKKYESVEDIVRDFYELRRKYYQRRKEYLLEQLTFDHDRLESKVRFVTEIIEGRLVVQNRKKKDLLKELHDRKYKSIPKKRAGLGSAGAPGGDAADAADDDEAAGGGSGGADHGYDYLLSMPIWNLTMEKVEQLQREMRGKEDEIRVLSRLGVNDLWRTDLDAFLAQWDHFCQTLEALEAQRPNNAFTASGAVAASKRKAIGVSAAAKKAAAAVGGAGRAALGKKAAVKKRAGSDDDDDDDDVMDDFEDDEDDFVPVKKAAGKGKGKAAAAAAVKSEIKVETSGAIAATVPKTATLLQPSIMAYAVKRDDPAVASGSGSGSGSSSSSTSGHSAPAAETGTGVVPAKRTAAAAAVPRAKKAAKAIKVDSDDDSMSHDAVSVDVAEATSEPAAKRRFVSSKRAVAPTEALKKPRGGKATASASASAAASAAASKAMVISDDDDDDDDEIVAAPAVVDLYDSTMDESFEFPAAGMTKPKAGSKAKPAAASVAKPKPKATATAKPKAAAAATKKGKAAVVVSETDDDDDDEGDDGDDQGAEMDHDHDGDDSLVVARVTKQPAASAGRGRAARTATRKVASYRIADDDDDDNDDDASDAD